MKILLKLTFIYKLYLYVYKNIKIGFYNSNTMYSAYSKKIGAKSAPTSIYCIQLFDILETLYEF
jgi:hypothetical protein